MGATEYDWALENNFHLQVKSAQLFDDSWPIVEATQKQMIALAREVGQKNGLTLPADGPAAVRAVFDQLSKDYPKSDAEMVSWYRDAAFRLVDFSRKTGLFDVPADYKLDVVETPPPLRASIDGAAYYPAPPFKTTGVGRYYVTPTGNDPAALQANNRAALADLSAHEGFPGHDWYYKVLTQAKGSFSPVRWLTPGAVETPLPCGGTRSPPRAGALRRSDGRATAGRARLYTPEERLYQLQGHALSRPPRPHRHGHPHRTLCLRRRDDAVLGGGRLPAGRLRRGRRAPATPSAPAARRRTRDIPLLEVADAGDHVSPRQGRHLRDARGSREGGGHGLLGETFHLEFIRQGTIPPGYFKTALLNTLAPTRQ
jgi:hypothetical protein